MWGFWITLVVLVAVAFALNWRNLKTAEELPSDFKAFQKNYLLVFFIMMAADWMQGPYVYKLYSEYGFGMRDIAHLFIAGFGSSMLFGTVVGSLADTYGRKANCMLFGVLYTLSCATKHFNNYDTLMFGRVLGGIATSILYSAFESWMVFEHTKRSFSPDLLSSTFSKAIFGNGIVAILSGVIAQAAVDQTGSYVTPFDLSAALLIAGTVIIFRTWPENFGDSSSDFEASVKESIRLLQTDVRILLVGCIQSLFEGAMYTFVFMWTPALPSDTPHGLVFACYMVCCMIGSAIFGMLMSQGKQPGELMVPVFAVAAVGLLIPVFSSVEMFILSGFFIFEVCCGIYWPAFGTQRSAIVPERVRSTIMNIFRVPLNMIVVFVLVYADAYSPAQIFGVCAMMLGLAAVLQAMLVKQAPAAAQEIKDAAGEA